MNFRAKRSSQLDFRTMMSFQHRSGLYYFARPPVRQCIQCGMVSCHPSLVASTVTLTFLEGFPPGTKYCWVAE
uniref:Uncharacterized protein n=1 Tax=Caenorhabditis japonica TaxID=281687 RepID=A0A8R1IJ53_CAEJA